MSLDHSADGTGFLDSAGITPMMSLSGLVRKLLQAPAANASPRAVARPTVAADQRLQESVARLLGTRGRAGWVLC
jgi:hypothetical protein